MTSDSAGREVYQDVEPDPDAVLEAHGVDSPEELVAAGGDHAPTTDDAIDADDTTAAELFDHLETVSTEPADPTEERDSTDAGEPDELAAIDVDWSFVGEPERTVRQDDSVDAEAADVARTRRCSSDETPSTTAQKSPETTDRERTDSTLTVRTGDDLELVGPEPTTDRVSNETFGTRGFEFGLLAERQ